MTSEAPQDVAALPQTEAGKRAADWMRSFALGNPAVDRAVRLIADAEREAAALVAPVTRAELADLESRGAPNPISVAYEAAAGLLDQNDRLREALRDANQIIAMTRQHLAADHPDCAYTALGVMNDAARARLADGIDAALSSGRGSGAEEAARNE